MLTIVEKTYYINSDFYTPTNSELNPTGKKKAVKDTLIDFNAIKQIGTDFWEDELKATNQLD